MQEIHVTTKGQIVIPANLRRKYHIKGGTKLRLIDDGEKIILMPITPEYIRSTRGLLRGAGLLKELKEERAREKD